MALLLQLPIHSLGWSQVMSEFLMISPIVQNVLMSSILLMRYMTFYYLKPNDLVI